MIIILTDFCPFTVGMSKLVSVTNSRNIITLNENGLNSPKVEMSRMIFFFLIQMSAYVRDSLYLHTVVYIQDIQYKMIEMMPS